MDAKKCVLKQVHTWLDKQENNISFGVSSFNDMLVIRTKCREGK